MNRILNLTSLALSLLCVTACQRKKEEPKILSEQEIRLPENALKGLEVADGLEVQLFAHEPMVRNPTNMDIDDRGRVWVTEGRNYRPWRNEDNPHIKEGDQLLILEDTDGDGIADERKVFYQGVDIDASIGICVLGNKVIVSCSPDVLILTDTNGDDKADIKEKLFTGISSPQNEHSVHAVVFGPDGKLYFNFGNAGKQISDKNGDPIIDVFGIEVNDKGNPYRQGMAFRCNPDGSEFEVLGHNFRNNYELAVDSYGTVWQSDNDDDGNKSCRINFIMEYGNFGYKNELNGAHWTERRVGMHKDVPERHWHQNDPGVVPNLLITGSGSPAGIAVYEGELLPAIYQGQIIHADAGPGITRAYPTTKDGAGFKAEMVNILARTTDNWHRPSDVAVAPDGSIFIADWYDPGVGGNLAGDPYGGRIFRVAPRVGKYNVDPPDYSTPETAVEALKSPTPATRYKAWTQLNDWGDQAEEALIKLWQDGNSRYRARALWLLTKMPGSEDQYINAGLEDNDPDIRLTAIRAARQADPQGLEQYLRKVLYDSAPEVRREVALALRNIEDAELSAEIWTNLAKQYDGTDRWYLEALGIAASDNWEKCLDSWLQEIGEDWKQKPGRDIIWRSRTPKSLEYQLTLIKDQNLSLEEVARLLRATDFQMHPDKSRWIAELLKVEHPDQKEFNIMVINQLDPVFVAQSPEVKNVVKEILPDLYGTWTYLDLVKNLDLRDQRENVFQLVLDNPKHEIGVTAANLTFEWSGVSPFKSVVEGNNQKEKRAVIQNLGRFHNDEGKSLLVEVVQDEQQSISLRRLAAENLSMGWGWVDRMLQLLEMEGLDPELRNVAVTKLLGAPRPMDRQLAMRVLGQNESTQDWPTFNVLAASSGNIETGKTAFQQFCGTCHQIAGEGTAFGPDLSEIGNKLGKEGILMSIINPDAGISFGFEGETITTKEGMTFAGYVLSETSNKIELRMMGGINQSISQINVESRAMSDNSLMTANLHLAMGPDKLKDVVEYLASLKNYQTMAENPYQGKVLFER